MPRSTSTARHVTPDSNQMSTMLRSFSSAVPPHFGQASPGGANASSGWVHHRSDALPSSNVRARIAFARLRASVASSSDSLHAVQTTAGIGVPHTRWREHAPFGMVADHLRHARLAPRRQPRDAVHGLLRALAQPVAVHADEPLRGRAEDHRVLAAPAVRIAVLVRLVRHERARGAQVLDDALVGREDLQPGVRPRLGGEAARGVDRIDDRQAVAHAGLEVVRAVSGRGVHDAGAGLELDVLGEHHDGIAVEERMPHREPVERASLRLGRAAPRARLARTAAAPRTRAPRR